MPSLVSLFSGGGLSTLGAMQAGFTPVLAVEMCPEIAAVYQTNLPGHDVLACPVEAVDYRPYAGADCLMASPVCTRASIASAGRGESDVDLAAADAVCRALKEIGPRLFVMENVWQFRTFESFRRIVETLETMGFFVHFSHQCSASFGVPQTRRRLVLRAVRDGLVPALPTPTRWMGWYEAIEDLLPTLPESRFADWQKRRLGPMLKTFLCGVQGEAGELARAGGTPAPVVTANHAAAKYRAFIANTREMHGGKDSGEALTIRAAASPVYSIAATSSGYRHKAALDGGRVVAMTPRALARFQSLPDSYVLPTKNALAAKIIGNGWPTAHAAAILRGLREAA